MQRAVVVDANDIKGILAKHFGVDPDKVIRSQYSYTVVLEEIKDEADRKGACVQDHRADPENL